MTDEDLIDDWDEVDFEIIKQWDEEAKNKRLEELEEYFKSDMEIRAKLLIKIDGLNYSLEQAYKDIKELQEENKRLKKDRDIMIKSYEDETKEYYDIIKEVREYITSYESISTIQGLNNLEILNDELDYKTIKEMTNRYLKVHDKLLEILDKGEGNEEI